MELTGGDDELWLVGNGRELNQWLTLAGRLGLGGRVKPHQFVDHSGLPGLWDAVDIGVFPSCSDEGFSMSIVESMARGKPIIATHLGGIPEGVGNEGLCGWLCANLDANDFARAIRLSRAVDLVEMGRNARHRAGGFAGPWQHGVSWTLWMATAIWFWETFKVPRCR